MAEGGALLRRYVGELLRRGFESLLLRCECRLRRLVDRPPRSLAAGCGADGGGDPADIEDKPWQLTSATGLTIPDGVVPSAAFTGGNVFGTAGCNTYRASYTLDGDSLEIGEPAGTLIACPPPVDEFERAYLDALGEVASWELDGEELVLSDADGNELLRYEVASIVGSWTVTGVNTGDAVVEPDRRHGADGPVRGRRIADGLRGLQQLHDVVHRRYGRHPDRARRRRRRSSAPSRRGSWSRRPPTSPRSKRLRPTASTGRR